MINIQLHNLCLPDHWACPLINGDYSGLTEEDEKGLNAFIEYWENDIVINTANISSNQESEFVKYHDAHDFGVLACGCFNYTFEIKKTSPLYST